MAKTITFFGLKGGIGKTTTLLNLGVYLASQGKRILVVDCDPQCSATEALLGFGGDFPGPGLPGTSVYELLEPVLAGSANDVNFKPTDLVQVQSGKPLFLLRGDLQLWLVESYLANAWDVAVTESVRHKIRFLAFSKLVARLTSEHSCDYVLVDTAPGGTFITQTALLACDGFFLPTTPDPLGEKSTEFSINLLWRWMQRYAEIIRTFPPFGLDAPLGRPMFLGAILQLVRKYEKRLVAADQQWKTHIASTLECFFRERPEICRSPLIKPNDPFIAELPSAALLQSPYSLIDFWGYRGAQIKSGLIAEYRKQLESIAEVLP